jgi:hypothetical protein
MDEVKRENRKIERQSDSIRSEDTPASMIAGHGLQPKVLQSQSPGVLGPGFSFTFRRLPGLHQTRQEFSRWFAEKPFLQEQS